MPEEAEQWGRKKRNVNHRSVWSYRMYDEITGGDSEGLTRTRRGWYVTVRDIHAEFTSVRYGNLEEALRAAVEARRIMRLVVNGRYA